MDLVGRQEIAERAGTTPGMVDAWRRRHADFPAPLVTLRQGPVWDWATVAPWVERQRTAPNKGGRPRKGGA